MDYEQIMATARANSRVNEQKLKTIKKKEEQREYVDKLTLQRRKEYDSWGKTAMSASLNKQQKAGLSKTTLNSHSSVSGFKHISSPSVTQTVRKISPAGSGKVAKGNGEQTSGSSHRQTSRSSHRQTSGLSHRQTSRSSHRQTSGLSHSQMAGSSHKQAVGSGKAQTSEADRKSAQMGRLSKEDMDSSSVSKVSSKVRKEGGTVKKVVPGGKATGQSGQCVKSRFKDQPGRSGHSSLKKTGQKDSSTMKGSLKDEPKGAVHVRHKKKEVSGSGSGPLNFAELMKMATDNKDGKKFKPEKGIKPNLSHKSEESDVTKHTMKNASKSEKLTKSNQNGIARQPLSEKIKSVNPFPTRSPVTPATAESPHNSMCGKHSSKQLPLVKSNSVKPKTVKANPTVASKSFYSGSVGRKSLARPSPYGTSSSYLEQLEQTFAEMKRKRAQLELEEDYDSYDDEDGFVVDDDEDDVDVSATIRNIFGYDRSKFANERECDMAMESSYSQQMFEERRSAKIGREEDIEDIKQEALMVSRKRAKKANKPKTKQSKLLF